MNCTFQALNQSVKQLPQYLTNVRPGLIEQFTAQLEACLDLLDSSSETPDNFAQTVFDLFENEDAFSKALCNLGQRPEYKNSSQQHQIEFLKCANDVYTALVQEGHLEDFLCSLKAPPPQSKKKSRAKSQKSDASLRFSYAYITRYQTGFQKTQIEKWRNQDLVDDEDESVNLATVRERNLLEEYLHTPSGKLSYMDFFTRMIEPLDENTVIALRGKLGVGKSLLTQFIVCDKLSQNKDNVILFIGQRSSANDETGRQLLRAFKEKRFRREKRKRRRFFIIVDEPDADKWKWAESEWRRLYAAAQYYSAKIILLIRDGSNDVNLLQYFPVDPNNTIYLQEAQVPVPMPAGWKKWIKTKKIPYKFLEELRQLPLFRLPIDNRLWRLSNQTLFPDSDLADCFSNTYILIDTLYVTRLRNKEVQTGANKKRVHDEEFYRSCDKLFQYVAFKLCENGGSVSWTEGMPNQSDNWAALMEDGFVENILKINSRKGQQSQNVINGFRYDLLYLYFLIREFRDRIMTGEGLDQVLPLLKRLDDVGYNVLVDGLHNLANDKKAQGIKNLQHFQKASTKRSTAQYNEDIASLINLLKH